MYSLLAEGLSFGMVTFKAINDSYGEERVLSVQIVCGCSVQ